MLCTSILSNHYCDVIMGAVASQITSLTIVYSIVHSGADHARKHQSSASLAFARGIHRWPVNSPHKWPVTRKMFQFDDVIMWNSILVPVASVWVNVASASSGAMCTASSEDSSGSWGLMCDRAINGLLGMASSWTPVDNDTSPWIKVSVNFYTSNVQIVFEFIAFIIK